MPRHPPRHHPLRPNREASLHASPTRNLQLFVSQTVIKESSAGDPDAAQRRLEFLKPFPRLDITEEVESLAAKLIAAVPLPPKAQADALHIAVAAVNKMNYLLTWNCTHIANTTLRSKIEAVTPTSQTIDAVHVGQRFR